MSAHIFLVFPFDSGRLEVFFTWLETEITEDFKMNFTKNYRNL